MPLERCGELIDRLDAAWELVKDWSNAEREQLRADVPKQGLAAKIGGRTVRDIAEVRAIYHRRRDVMVESFGNCLLYTSRCV